MLELLKEPENRTRELAKIELGKRDTSKVIAAVNKWIKTLDTSDPDYRAQPDGSALGASVAQRRQYESSDCACSIRPNREARAAAGRVLCYWRDRVPGALGLFKMLADDPNPRVRLEAVRDASFFRSADAADAALTALKHSTDYYLDYTLGGNAAPTQTVGA